MNYLIEDFLENWKVKRKRDKTEETVKTYRYNLEKFFEFVIQDGGDTTHLTEHDVKQYFKKLDEEMSVSTFQKIHTIVRTYLKYQGHEEYMKTIEYKYKDTTKAIAPKSLTKDEINKIKREIEKKNKKTDGSWKKGGKMQVALIYLLLYTGIRVFEAVGLNLRENIELSERKGTLKFIGKGNKYREVPIPKEAREKLLDYLEERDDEVSALFVSNRKQRISIRNVQDIIQKLGDACQFKETLHPHIFRHTFCYNAVKELPVTTVAYLAGHSSVNTTMIYTQPNLQDASDKLDDMYNK